MKYSRLLVTGGAGFIGSNFIRYVLNNYPEVFVLNLDILTYAGSLNNLKDLPINSQYKFIEMDICEQDSVSEVINNNNIDAIVHFAAESHVDRSILGPSVFVRTNILGTFSLLESARNIWLLGKKLKIEKVRFHHISTDEVFGSLESGEPAFKEDTKYSPNSPYAASKASSDHLVRSYHHTYGMPFTLTNCSNNYGPYQFPEKLIPLMVLNAIEGKPLPIYGDGLQIRDWLFVEDHCEAIWQVLQEGKNGNSYNIGGNNQLSNNKIVDMVCKLIDEFKPNSPFSPHKDLKIFVSDRPGHDRRYAMDISKIKNDLGWTPKHDFYDGLKKTVEWYLKNEYWVSSIRNQQKYSDWVDQNYSQRGTL